jgi:uncharacterized membrane protein YhiD involved in acid resistance
MEHDVYAQQRIVAGERAVEEATYATKFMVCNQACVSNLEGQRMTPEDEEFNRVEMESRVKQEHIRAMRKTTREEKISRPAVYEVPANNRMIASHQDHVRRLMDELAIARVCIRELGDRLAKLEGKQ